MILALDRRRSIVKDELRSALAGILSGVVTSCLSVPAMGATAAIAMPSGWSVALWSALVVFGLGGFLPALMVHASALLVARANALIALASFCIAVIATIAVLAGLTYAGGALAASVVDAIAATLAASTLRSDSSFRTRFASWLGWGIDVP